MLPVAADGTCRAPESSAKTNRMKQHAKRVIAFYLPQYHPFPENDRWWGAGFTEWRNVVKARPLFRGHYQPHLPADLGFYDLRVPEVRQQQAALAERYGLSGFCYYHYWFNGHRLMQRPVEEMLASGKPDFPFMLCWANENWTRAWDGGEQEVLIRQEYSEEDDRAHIRYLLDEVFRDPRYIRVDGKPVFAVYRSALFPDIRRTIEVWREEAAARGVELYLCRVESFNAAGREELAVGFDAAIEFQPFTPAMTDFWEHRPWRQKLMYHLLAGIILFALAGSRKEQSEGSRQTGAQSRSRFRKGLVICLLAGIFGPMINFAFVYGAPLQQQAVALGADPVYAGNAVWSVALTAGFLINAAECIRLFRRNRTWKHYASRRVPGITLAAVAGIVWYMSIMLYGMGGNRMGEAGASVGWAVMQSVAIIAGNAAGICSGEWRATTRHAQWPMAAGLCCLVLGVVILSRGL